MVEQTDKVEQSMQLFDDEKTLRSDLMMVSMAINKGWDIPDHVLSMCPEKIVEILTNKKTSTRAKLRAVEVLIKMRQQNINQMPKTKTSKSIRGTVVSSISRQDILKDELFLEYCRNHKVDSDAGVPSSDSE